MAERVNLARIAAPAVPSVTIGKMALEALSLPATFFVVSQWIGSETWPWWDRQQGVRHPWMTWANVRHLHERGFDIGAHTRTHVDLGQIKGIAAREEIVGGRTEIERHLGVFATQGNPELG